MGELAVCEFLRRDTSPKRPVRQFAPSRTSGEHRSASAHEWNQYSPLRCLAHSLGNYRNQWNIIAHRRPIKDTNSDSRQYTTSGRRGWRFGLGRLPKCGPVSSISKRIARNLPSSSSLHAQAGLPPTSSPLSFISKMRYRRSCPGKSKSSTKPSPQRSPPYRRTCRRDLSDLPSALHRSGWKA